jgi:hypothetical protein
VPELGSLGSVRGALSNGRPYRELVTCRGCSGARSRKINPASGRDFRLAVQWPGRCLVGELADGVGDPAPDGRAVVIVLSGELVGARAAFVQRFVAVPLSIRLAARQMSIG